jgi:hypothetical protein
MTLGMPLIVLYNPKIYAAMTLLSRIKQTRLLHYFNHQREMLVFVPVLKTGYRVMVNRVDPGALASNAPFGVS